MLLHPLASRVTKSYSRENWTSFPSSLIVSTSALPQEFTMLNMKRRGGFSGLFVASFLCTPAWSSLLLVLAKLGTELLSDCCSPLQSSSSLFWSCASISEMPDRTGMCQFFLIAFCLTFTTQCLRLGHSQFTSFTGCVSLFVFFLNSSLPSSAPLHVVPWTPSPDISWKKKQFTHHH